MIGNGRIAALTDTGGRILWWCDVVMEGAVASEAAYLRNTAIVETSIRDAGGNALRITDFTPRFKRFERVFNPPQT